VRFASIGASCYSDRMKQFNIRSERAHELAMNLSRRLGKPMHRVVEDALEALDATLQQPVDEAELWGSLLHDTQSRFRDSKSTFEIEDLYDPETGLPA